MAVLAADPQPQPISIVTRLDTARALHAKGDLARAAQELEAALSEIHARLGRSLADCLPAIPATWQGEPPETQDLAGAGGGMAVTRAYGRDDSSMNAALILDSPAVPNAAGQMAAGAPAQPNVHHIKLGGEDAMLRWDSNTRSGEITMVLGGRVLLQIAGDNLGTSDLLIEAARSWNIAAIRKLLAL